METRPNKQTSEFSILHPGENCWRVETARRTAVLIDGADYFEAFESACQQAAHCIFILGWDFERHEPLGRDEDSPTLEQFIYQLLDRNGDLHIYLLLWDFSMIYAAEREWFQSWRLQYNSHERLHVQFDNRHPLGGSQHQKIVVVDDTLAFCGGIDLSRWRWDTRQHMPDDPRRTDPDGKTYPPFHDVMLLVDDAAAGALAEVARTRWKHSGSDEQPVAAARAEHDPWPERFEPLFQDQAVAIARTYPGFEGRPEVREVEHLFLDSIAAAKHYIYVENQYFTSRAITGALAERLLQEDAPEVLLVLPHHTGGWLEQLTMDALRLEQLQRLREADRHGRLRVYYADQPGLPEDQCISVHAKIMIIDDYFLHAGSANTSDRSLGMDSECDLAIEARGHESIPWLLHSLLSEHLDCSIEAVAAARADLGSLLAAVEQLRRPGRRTLSALDETIKKADQNVIAEADLIDPHEPINSEYFVHRAIPRHQAPSGRRQLLFFLGFIVLLLMMAAAWRWTPMADWITPAHLERSLEWFTQPSVRVLTVLFVLVVASLLMVPLTLLVVASAVLLGPWLGFGCSMAGALISAWVGFSLGRVMGAKAIQRLSGSQVHRLSKRLSEQGVMAVAILRMLPIAPYTIVNLVAGASHLRLGQFMIGSALGLIPGLTGLTVFSDSLLHAVMNPSLESLGVLAIVAGVIVVVSLVLRRLLKTS